VLFFLLLNIFKKKRIIITLHSVDPNYRENFIYNLIILIQRIFHKITIFLLNFTNTTIVVHSEIHKIKLQKIFKKKIHIIYYPAENNFSKHKKIKSKRRKILFFGLVRKDKGIVNFIKNINLQKYKIDIIGKVLFNEILKIKKKNITISNIYLNESKIKSIFSKYDFLLLPYDKSYPGSAGPLFLALSFRLPVIFSDIPIFRYFLKKYKIGYIFNKRNFESQIDKISYKQYKEFVYNGIKYCKENNWNNLTSKYEKIY
jgi:glycosyltransferase involved in cell wall biosynthesis